MRPEQDDKFIDFVKSLGLGYWHWIDGSWLLVDSRNREGLHTAIRDKLLEIAPGKNSFVAAVETSKEWAGFGPSDKQDTEKNMFHWLHKNWA